MRRFVETVFLLVCGILFWWLFFLPYAHVAATETKAPSQEVVGPLRVTFHWPVAQYEAIVTGYSGIESGCGTHCITASGTRPATGRTIACPRVIPFHRFIVVAGVVYTCEDRTAKRFDGRFDIWFGEGTDAWRQAKRFGKQTLTVTVFD